MKHLPKRTRHYNPLTALGPGLITGAADDDPSGIATYSQAGAQFGFQMLWTMVFTYPLQGVFQSVCARIGRVTGKGLAANIKTVFPRWVLLSVVALLLFANTLNVSADVAAMGEAGGAGDAGPAPPADDRLRAADPGAADLRALPPLRLVPEVADAVAVRLCRGGLHRQRAVGRGLLRTVWPQFKLDKDSPTMIVAIFGTTISPYLFFWQASEEVEEIEDAHRRSTR